MSPRESGERQHRPESASGQAEEAAAVDSRDAALTAEVDDLLDEIDDVLEENAEEFVRGFVQKGGQ